MQRRVVFDGKLLPYLLVAPQLAVTLVFFFWPAAEAVYFSTQRQDAFGLSSLFVGFENFATMFSDPVFWTALTNNIIWTAIFLTVSMAMGLFAATLLRGEPPTGDERAWFVDTVLLPMLGA